MSRYTQLTATELEADLAAMEVALQARRAMDTLLAIDGPLELQPLPPLPTIRPIQPPALPPIGTRTCQQRYICDKGQCTWRTVCQ